MVRKFELAPEQIKRSYPKWVRQALRPGVKRRSSRQLYSLPRIRKQASEEVWMMETKSSRPEQARIQQAADAGFSGLELPTRNADPQLSQRQRRFLFAFAV